MRSKSNMKHAIGIGFELTLGVFLLGLLLIIWLPPKSDASMAEPVPAAKTVTGAPAQGTPIVAAINGSIAITDPTFTGQRHFRSGVPGDRACQLFGANGARFYDEILFLNNSSVSQRVFVQFNSGCTFNTFMAAYSPQFDTSSICQNFIASAGLSGSVNWEFTVCNNSSFSIVVYGLEPGVTCPSYSYTVFGNGITLIGPASRSSKTISPQEVQPQEAGAFSASDVEVKKKKRKRKVRGTDTRFKRIIPPGVAAPRIALPEGGTPLVAAVNDSIDGNEQSFSGPRHFRTGIPGDPNCLTIPENGTRFYDEYFFMNTSPVQQKILVNFNSACGINTFMAAYGPQFNPGDICANFIASAGRSGPVEWEFTVCPNATFSLVVYNVTPGVLCSGYSYSVFANGTVFLGTIADIAVSKTATPGPLLAGSSITYNITVTNNGPSTATGITINDPLPAGTTFSSLVSSLGTALVCNTPPVGSNGTVSCLLNQLGRPGTSLLNAASFSIVANVIPSFSGALSNTATVSRIGIDPNNGNNSSKVTTTIFNMCVQDTGSGSVFRFHAASGAYQYINCQKGINLTGTARVTISGCKITLTDTGPDPKRPDRNVQMQINTCSKTGQGSVQILSSGQTFPVNDANITNNTCICQ